MKLRSAEAYANSIRSVHDYFDILDKLLVEQDWDCAEVASRLLSQQGPHASSSFLQITLLPWAKGAELEELMTLLEKQPFILPSISFHDYYFGMSDHHVPRQTYIAHHIFRVDRKLNEYGTDRNRSFLSYDAFDAIAVLHLQVLYHIHVEANYEAAYEVHTQIMRKLTDDVLRKIKDCNWFMPIVYVMCTDLRNTAKMADELGERDEERDASYYESCAAFIMEIYRACIVDTSKDISASKKVGILNLTNQLFRIYFKINKLNLLKPLIRTIDNSEHLHKAFSMADKVTYYYFLGRKAMFDSDLVLAEKSLSYAFRNCPVECSRNKRLVLVYLIPVKMFLGHMPNPSILHKYELDEFHEVVEAVKLGNLAQLDAALAKHEDFFIQCGIFLMLEKLRTITFRNLFKRVALIVGKNQIPLDAFLVVLQSLGVTDVDAEELACIVANLIAQNKIKGYISHQHQKLVISKQKAFPELSKTL